MASLEAFIAHDTKHMRIFTENWRLAHAWVSDRLLVTKPGAGKSSSGQTQAAEEPLVHWVICYPRLRNWAQLRQGVVIPQGA